MVSTLLYILIPATFYFTENGNMYGTTTSGIPFSQITINESPRIQEFYLKDGEEILNWFVCEVGVTEDINNCK